ncbi:SGNH/GDSL hydrolase family protein [Agromyces silvae]|uniref:SGNH/GDSL hydrolase family protein n=1 Tax=Agromyces silvae TaxID=3388266 RepID=UPI00280AD1E0|nr:SGNH/GDSL hydrolase family protein [Agromyces protaetiae]
MADLDEASTLLAGSEPLRWLFTGDSITHGAAHTNGSRDYVQLFEERVRWELGRTRDHVLRTAISGRTVPDLLDDAEWSLSQYRADVVSLMFGMNDANTATPDLLGFADDLTRAVALARAAGARAVIVHTPNRIIATETAARRANLASYAEVVRQVAVATDAVLVDHHAAWSRAEQAGAVERWIGHGCHPNAEGHRVLYRELAAALGIWDPASPTGRGFIPAAELLPERRPGPPPGSSAGRPDDGVPHPIAADVRGRI